MSPQCKFASSLLAVSAFSFLASAIYLATEIENGQDAVKLRNSLIYEVRSGDPYDWSPEETPNDFLQGGGKGLVPAQLLEALDGLFSPSESDQNEFHKAIAIGRHLVEKKRRPAIPIQSNTLKAYLEITAHGKGYCADYTQVFNGLATLADIPVREWGMSFDGYGGDGHAFNEVYDRTLDKWIFIDTFYSAFVTDQTRTPLSVAEFRDMLRKGQYDALNVEFINPTKFSFASTRQWLEYYRKGMDSLYLIWGNNVLAYDTHTLLAWLGSVSRVAEQAAAIILGHYPKIIIRDDWKNDAGLRELMLLRAILILSIISALVAISCLLYLALVGRRVSFPVNETVQK